MVIHDISVTLTENTVTWQNAEAALSVQWHSRIGVDGAEANGSSVSYGSHFGTHLDAPLHFVAQGGSVEQLNLATLIGPCQVVEIPDIDHPSITAEDLSAANVPDGTRRLLLKTANSRARLMHKPKFYETFVAVAPSGARWLLEHGVSLVGIDYLGIGSAVDGTGGDTHRILLGEDVVVVEGLDLHAIEAGPYSLICLPLKVSSVEGAPVRAVLIDGVL